MKRKLIDNIAYIFVAIYLFIVMIYFIIFRENVYVQVHDFLDSWIGNYKMLRDTNCWFSDITHLPYLHGEYGIDVHCATPLKFQSLLYMICPTFFAFILSEFARLVISVFGGCFLGRIYLKEKFRNHINIIVAISFLYGILPFIPAESIAFSSIPIGFALVLLIYMTEKKRLLPFMLIYPAFSTFSYFGIFICGYILLFFIIDAIVHKKPKWIMLATLGCVIAGYVVTEYRLFYQMLFSDEPSLRAVSYVMPSYTFKEILKQCFSVFKSGQYHAGSLQQYVALPFCMVYFFVLNCQYVKNGEKHKILSDKFNWLVAWFLFNIILYGLDLFKPFQDFVAFVCPPLKGLSFARGVWFNPFIVYAAFCVALCNFERILNLEPKKIALCAAAFFLLSVESKHFNFFVALLVVYIITLNIKRLRINAKKSIPCLIVLFAILIVPFNGEMYNNIHLNLKNQRLRLNGKADETALTYNEFYSESLFEKIKKEIGYNGEWSVAYGMHPSILYYNGIATLDGYHSYYAESYKQKFRKIIAPELEVDEANKKYFDDWGGRAYIFSPNISSEPLRKMNVESAPMYIDPKSFSDLEGRYIFSRVAVTNADELGFECLGNFTEQNSPYTIWVYKN